MLFFINCCIFFTLISSFQENLIILDNHTKTVHHDSWNGRPCKKEPIKRSSSLPSLITQWTCVRCLLENSCSSALTCAACDADCSIFETDKRQIGARKSKKQNLRKTSRLKVASEFLANILNGSNVTNTSANDAKIMSKAGCYLGSVRSESSTARCLIFNLSSTDMAQLTGISRSERRQVDREDWTLLPIEAMESTTTLSYTNTNNTSQRSPKRHSPSIYERVKSKVSRSLSNGSVVHKLSDHAIQRPTSLVVSEARQDDALWSCDNCTLDNAPGLEQCEACEAPRSPAPCSGVVISVPAWEPRALSSAGPLSYRRSFSDVESVTNVSQKKIINRRSLNEDEPPAVPPHSVGFNTRPRYSYIGITNHDIPPPLPKKQNNKLGLVPVKAHSEATSPVGDVSNVSSLKRMWTCQKCSYAYNPLWSTGCDICGSFQSPPSLTQPTLITVTKDGTSCSMHTQSPIVVSRDSVRYIPQKTATLATAESDLDDQVDPPSPVWTCKKCTLLNAASRTTCEACGGSKLRSIMHLEDATLRKGESWVCPSCTLRNPLSAQTCNACKTLADFLDVPRESRVFGSRSPSPRLCTTPVNSKVVTPRHRNSVRRNGSSVGDKRHSRVKDPTHGQVRFFYL